jgi:hypothetical protein
VNSDCFLKPHYQFLSFGSLFYDAFIIQLIFAVVNCGVFFDVRTEFINIIFRRALTSNG